MRILLNSRDEIMSVDLNKVVYFLADGNFTRIVLENKMILTCGIGLIKMEELLAQQANPKLYNDNVIWPDKVKINLDYLNNWSFFGDIRLIFQTVFH